MGQLRSPADLAVPYAPVGATAARRWVREQLGGWGMPPTVVEDAALVVTELVGNAVVHGRPDETGSVRVACTPCDGGGVRVAVTDHGGDRVPEPRRAHDMALTGRGLRIVAGLASDWGIDTRGQGLTVWAVLDR